VDGVVEGRGARSEERAARKEERGKRKEERGKREEGREKREEGRGKREERRGKREEGREKREEGREKREEGRMVFQRVLRRGNSLPVIPAKSGIQRLCWISSTTLDSRLRGNDGVDTSRILREQH
jgi:hypothetical protein